MGLLEGKVVVVTGGAKRVGRAITLQCAQSGADVLIHYRRSEAEALATAEEVRALGRRAVTISRDLTERSAATDIVAAAGSLGGIDVLVNSAASFARCNFLEASDDDWEGAWETSYETNLLAPARLARAAAPILAQRRGTIVNIIDVGARLAWPAYAQHTACKAALGHLTRTLAVAFAPQIRVVGVSPGIAEFPDDYSEQMKAAALERTPLGRPGTPEDIAQAVVFLASQPYTTGVVLAVDGGWSIPR